MTIQEKSNLFKIMSFWRDDIDNGYDKFIGVFGDEGKGKSLSLALPIIDTWYTQILKKDIPKGRFCVDFKEFGRLLREGQPYDICLADEAGDALYKKDHSKTFNKLLYKTYTIIRGKKFLTVMVMPDFFDLDSSFRKRRLHGAFHVYKRVPNKCKKCSKEFAGMKCIKCGSTSFTKGYIKYRYYTKSMLEKISEINRNNVIQKMNVVRAIEGVSYMYDGPLLEEYLPMKAAKMDAAIEEVEQALSEFEEGEGNDSRRRCPNCRSVDFRYTQKGYKCRQCPCMWDPSQEEIDNIVNKGGKVHVY